MQSRDSRDRDVEIQHKATQGRNEIQSEVASGHKPTTTSNQREDHHKNRDFWGPEWWLVYVSFGLAVFTAGLYWAAMAPLRAARRVRSVIRGAGMPPGSPPFLGSFMIRAHNHGAGLAVIRTVSWKLARLNDFSTDYGDPIFLGEVVAPGERDQLVTIATIPADFQNQMIVVRFDYFDFNRNRPAIIEYAMRLNAPGMHGLPVFVETAPGVLIDDFPIEVGPQS
jgi:hypothetical protein